MILKEFFTEHPKVAIAFSGGVDSSYLFYAAGKYAKEVKAYYVKAAFQPQFEMDDAMRLATELNGQMEVLHLDILSDEKVTANPSNRCYYCKKRIFTAIISDDAGDRPGMKALQELEVLSPLRLCGLTKPEIRKLSKEAGLFTWDKPAYACLATRIPTGQHIDARVLERTEEAEGYLFSLGFSDFRVRTVGEMAKIQVTKEQFPLLVEHRKEIVGKLSEMYEAVCLDLEARNE